MTEKKGSLIPSDRERELIKAVLVLYGKALSLHEEFEKNIKTLNEINRAKGYGDYFESWERYKALMNKALEPFDQNYIESSLVAEAAAEVGDDY